MSKAVKQVVLVESYDTSRDSYKFRFQDGGKSFECPDKHIRQCCFLPAELIENGKLKVWTTLKICVDMQEDNILVWHLDDDVLPHGPVGLADLESKRRNAPIVSLFPRAIPSQKDNIHSSDSVKLMPETKSEYIMRHGCATENSDSVGWTGLFFHEDDMYIEKGNKT